MKLNKEQQSTFIMIATILIVSIISFIAIFNIIWGIIAQPIHEVSLSIAYFFRTQNIDYNFEVPASNSTQVIQETPTEQNTTANPTNTQPNTTAETSTTQTETPVIQNSEVKDINYNFKVPEKNTNDASVNFESYTDAILSDAQLAGYGSGNDTPQINLQIVIPKIGVNSPVLQGLGADDLLERGFWTYPGSYTLGEGEVVMLCHRRYFGPYDPRSCWFLDKLSKGDEIIMKYAESTLKYEIVGVNVFEGDDPLIYSISGSDDYIKIVTCTPLYSNSQRLVVLAKRVS